MVTPRKVIAFMIGLALLAGGVSLETSSPAEADHGVVRCGGTGERACILTFSPFVERIIKQQGEITWCLNPRAAAYPRFREQVAQVTGEQARQLQVTHREVPYPASQSDTSCTVRHDMPANHGCGQCGAWIYLSAYPMLIEYRWQTGYTNWQSTIGHEQGHGFCLLDEHYDKVGFRSYINAFGRWLHGAPTVMDSGTWALSQFAPLGVWAFTDYDLDRCQETIGRNLRVQCGGAGDLYWDPCLPDGGEWVFSAAACPVLEGQPCTWSPLPAPYGRWFGPNRELLWDDCDPRWNGRHSPYKTGWMSAGESIFDDHRLFRLIAPAC